MALVQRLYFGCFLRHRYAELGQDRKEEGEDSYGYFTEHSVL